MDFFGLDIGSVNAKLVQLKKKGKTFELLAAGIEVLPAGSLVSEAKSDKEKIAKAIQKLVSQTKVSTKNVVSSLPTSQIFEKVIELPPLTEVELSSAISWEAEQYVPFPLKEAQLSWEVARDGSKGQPMEVLLVAAPQSIILKLSEILQMANLNPIALETEMVSLSRVFAILGAPPSLIVSQGARSTNLGVSINGHLFLSSSVALGSSTYTRVLSNEFGITQEQAERYLKMYGIFPKQYGTKIRKVLLPLLEGQVKEIKKIINFWLSKHPQEQIQRVILSGGGSLLPGLLEYLAEALNLEVEVGDPFAKITKPQKIMEKLASQAPTFGVACGLAMKEE